MVDEVTIGDCRLILGDCREILPQLPKFDLILTDPPYGLAETLKGGTWGKQYEGESKVWDAAPWEATPQFFESANTFIIWGGNYFDLPPTRCFLVHDKMLRGMTFADCEMAWTNMDKNARVFSYMVPRGFCGEPRDHPTQKPVPLMEWCIGFAPGAQTVCDPFFGSGTTGVACARMGLQFVGIERERKYFDIACERIERAYAQPRLFDEKVGSGETAEQANIF